MSEPVGERLLEQAEAFLRRRLGGRVSGLRVLVRQGGVILQGQAFTFHVKQLVQHIAMEELRLIVVANDIEVRRPLPSQELSSGDPG